MKRLLIFSAGCMLLPTLLWAHAFYVSTCSITHDPDTREVRVRMNIFPDDLELALVQRGAPALGLMTPNPDPSTRNRIDAYLVEKFELEINGNRVPLWLEDWGLSEEVMKVTLLYDDICDIQSIAVRNDILTEVYDDQANVVTVKIGDFRETLNLNKLVSRQELRLEN